MRRPMDQTFAVFGFGDTRFQVVLTHRDGTRSLVEEHATYDQAMLRARVLAPRTRKGTHLSVYGCYQGKCGVPFVLRVNTPYEKRMPWAEQYQHNPVGQAPQPFLVARIEEPDEFVFPLHRHVTFGEAMLAARAEALEGQTIDILGCFSAEGA